MQLSHPRSTEDLEKLPPAQNAEETTLSRLPGVFFILLGVLLMALSALTALPGEATVRDEPDSRSWENVSTVGSASDDFIEAKNGTRDYISCGLGDDVASPDARDFVLSDCETIFVG